MPSFQVKISGSQTHGTDLVMFQMVEFSRSYSTSPSGTPKVLLVTQRFAGRCSTSFMRQRGDTAAEFTSD